MKPKHPLTLGNMRALRRGVAAACIAAIMSGYASSPNDDTYSLYAEPERYDFLDCPSIVE
jgi:hypothetical protein